MRKKSTSIVGTAVWRFAALYVILGLLFFLPAGTFRYWQGWAFMLVLSVPMLATMVYLYIHDPALLERRLRTNEKQRTQKLVIVIIWLFFLPAYILPGFDNRFGWSGVPLAVEIIAFVLIFGGYVLFAWVLKTNSFASRVVEVQQGQQVISTGPYAAVRHPMYVAVLLIFGLGPLALGSYWAMIPVVLLAGLLVLRIRGEEKEMLAGLPGYKEYAEKVKYRLIPCIW